MAKPNATSIKHRFSNFHLATEYAYGDEAKDVIWKLSSYLRKFSGFQSIVREITSVVKRTDSDGRIRFGPGEGSMSGNWAVMRQVAIAFYAGVAYGQRFGDNLAEPLPLVNPAYFARREEGDETDNSYIASDWENVVRWRQDALGDKAVLEENGIEARALARIEARQAAPAPRTEASEGSKLKPIRSGAPQGRAKGRGRPTRRKFA